MCKIKIIVLRYGHRPSRDKRVSTHLALVARAFGAHEAWFDTKDKSLERRIAQVNEAFGGSFAVKTGVDLMSAIKEAKKEGFCVVHLTMYGIPLPQLIEEIRGKSKLLVLVGGPKVPRYFYEVAALAVFLDWLYEGDEFNFKFEGGRIEIEPCVRGKKIRVLR